MSTIRSFRTGRPRIGSIVTFGADVGHEHLAGERVPAVDHHRVGAADPVRARPAEAQRAVVVPLDLVQDLDEPVERVGLAPSNSSHQESCETSGLYRRIFSVRRDLVGARADLAAGRSR